MYHTVTRYHGPNYDNYYRMVSRYQSCKEQSIIVYCGKLTKTSNFDKSVLTNPGMLKLPIARIYAGGESKARNQRMQAMLRMIGYGENLGSGFPLILSAWNEKHWLKPELIELPELMQVKLILHIVNEENEPKNEPKELSERQLRVLHAISTVNTLTREQISQQLDVALGTIKRDITALRNKGSLDRTGGNTYGNWVILKDFN